MKRGLYRRLAAQGILKNRRLYTPYLLTCMGMVMMHYITGYLGCTDAIANMKGRRVFSEMMVMGGYILGIFSAVFLFYTNSFLIRRRKKNLACTICWA